MPEVVITGIGLITPLGDEPSDVVERVLRNESAAQPVPFSPPVFCRRFAPIVGFDAERHFPENKTLRLMNRDAQLAVVAARRAIQDAAIRPGVPKGSEDIALYGATGMSGMASEEVARLVRDAAAADGSLDLGRFGQVTLRRIRPVLSFKLLANMPICFVSIFEHLCGPNAVYTPWEGNGAQALAAGVRAVRSGDVPCALVGGCDVKTHALSLVSLQQLGVFDSWKQHGHGCIPGEGAAFLVLEDRAQAERRGARVYAVVRSVQVRTVPDGSDPGGTYRDLLERALEGRGFPNSGGQRLDDHEAGVARSSTAHPGAGGSSSARPGGAPSLILAADDGDAGRADAERAAWRAVGLDGTEILRPKTCLGNLFAAAAAVQVALAAELARGQRWRTLLVDCFGHGSEQAAFVLEAI
jgi:hypothetical protein